MKRFMSGLVLFFLSSLLLGAGAFAFDRESASFSLAGKSPGDIISDSKPRAVRFNPAVERVKGNLRKPAGYGEAISPSLQAARDSDILAEQYDLSIERAIGDLGKPADYDQTILEFRQIIPNFDEFIDQYDPAFDWRDSGNVTPADDQGSCGSCWAFASVGALESKILIAGGSQYDLSEQQVISCNSYGYSCCGGSMNALQFWYSQGPMQESCTGYGDFTTSCPPDTTNVACSSMDACAELDYNTTGYYTVDMSNNDNIKASLLTDGPSYFRYDVYSDFSTHWNSAAPGAVYTQASGTLVGGHAVLIIGWDDSKGAWLCKNSWGPSGGPDSDGTFWIAYSGHVNDLNFGMANVQISGGGGGGDVIQTWTPASNTEPWGIAYTSDNTVWVGDGWGAGVHQSLESLGEILEQGSQKCAAVRGGDGVHRPDGLGSLDEGGVSLGCLGENIPQVEPAHRMGDGVDVLRRLSLNEPGQLAGPLSHAALLFHLGAQHLHAGVDPFEHSRKRIPGFGLVSQTVPMSSR